MIIWPPLITINVRDNVLLPTLIHGCETRPMNESVLARIQAVETRFIRTANRSMFN